MTRVKICGLTNAGDAFAAINYGADLVGFIGVRQSPRYISADAVDDIVAACPPFVNTVAVVNGLADAEEYGTSLVQFYVDSESESRCRYHAGRRIRCVRIKDAGSLDEIRGHSDNVAAFLLDAYHVDKLGGSGESFNWELAVEAKKLTDKPIILAGGLTPDNVQDALDKVRPYAVDIASGVESAPGIKDHAKIRAFIRAVREWDLKHG